MSHPLGMIGLMFVVASIAVAVFGILYRYWDVVEVVAGKRLVQVLAVVAALSMYVALRYQPEAALHVVTEPAREIADRMVQPLLDRLDHLGPSQSTVP